MKNIDARPLFIFEMANNHMGSVEHGLRIVRAMHEVAKDFPFNFGVKLQYRDIDTFIHPDYKGRTDLKFVKRFSETRLTWEECRRIKDAIDECGFVSVCTPFDEVSVDRVEEHGFDILKVASCSLTDWPLLERVGGWNRPIIASTGGMSVADIDRAVSFFQHRNKKLTLMHCVGRYPTYDDCLNLGQIAFLQARYPRVVIGYSTHERPDNYDAVKIAIGMGVMVFEKHVGVQTNEFRLNSYSAAPEQVGRWLASAASALEMCGVRHSRCAVTAEEQVTLRTLQRGVFARKDIAKGERLSSGSVFYAIPVADGQFVANDISKYTDFHATVAVGAARPLCVGDFEVHDKREQVYKVVTEVKKLLKRSKVTLPGEADLEISHHYGIESFHQFGCTIITVVNREYCKKLIILLPGQMNPEHVHKVKEETFMVVHGDITIDLNGSQRHCKPGDLIVVELGVTHSFSSKSGAIMEELSSTHYRDDSYYTDSSIPITADRKTLITYWLGDDY